MMWGVEIWLDENKEKVVNFSVTWSAKGQKVRNVDAIFVEVIERILYKSGIFITEMYFEGQATYSYVHFHTNAT